jgi:hypothetical protein
MAETFLLAEEKHAQEPFLLHRTRSFRVARSFHDHPAGQQPQRVSCAELPVMCAAASMQDAYGPSAERRFAQVPVVASGNHFG